MFKLLLCILLLSFQLTASTAITNPTIEQYPKYETFDTGTWALGRSHPIDLNDNGQVLIQMFDDIKLYAFLWDKNNGLKVIDIPDDAICYRLNNIGQVAGTFGGGLHAFIWDPITGFSDLGKFDNQKISIMGFNDSGQILLCSERSHLSKSASNMYLVSLDQKVHINKIIQEFNPTWQLSAKVFPRGNYWYLEGGNSFSFLSSEGKITTLISILDENGHVINNQIAIIQNDIVKIISVGHKKIEDLIFADNSSNILYTTTDENMIRLFFYDGNKSTYSPESTIIINSLPTTLRHLTPYLKTSSNGQEFYSLGVKISAFLDFDLPMWREESWNFGIFLRNDVGVVVGSVDTIYPYPTIYVAFPVKN